VDTLDQIVTSAPEIISAPCGEGAAPDAMLIDSNADKAAQKAEAMQRLGAKLDNYSLEDIVEVKISRFLDQISSFHPENLFAMIMGKVEKPLIKQILQRTGGNQVHAAKILGINRNTLRKKMKIFGF
jgi:Fis family transcriptional regulator